MVTSVELELDEAFSGGRLPDGERGTVATVCPVLLLMMDVHGQLTAQDRRAVLKWQRRPRAQTLLHHNVSAQCGVPKHGSYAPTVCPSQLKPPCFAYLAKAECYESKNRTASNTTLDAELA